MNRFTAQYWTERYNSNKIGWDTGAPTSPFVDLFKTIENKALKILIPGCGNAYEGELLHKQGFKNVTLLDASEKAKSLFLDRVPDFPANNFLIGDFFSHQNKYDLILEQTFFCALEPSMRPDYAKKMSELLEIGGHIKGVFFNFPLTEKGPPFGGSKGKYLEYFKPHFNIVTLEPCRNSIKPRMGNELFIDFQKPLN